MNADLIDPELLHFWLYDWLDLNGLLAAGRFSDHSSETIDAVIDLAARIAEQHFLPHYREADIREPQLVDSGVIVLPQVAQAVREYASAGLLAAPFPAEAGGGQMPETACAAMLAHIMAANISTSGFIMLTTGNARLLMSFGTPAQKRTFAHPQIAGEVLGTMCLSEPQAGSSLADIRTRAVHDGTSSLGERFRITGNKMWISSGDHDVTPNIFHLVLAKVVSAEGALPAGTKGISLFLVPKVLPDTGARNDVVVAGLNHKMGFRGIPNCLLNFGEGVLHKPGGKVGAIGYLIGEEGRGLEIMFHMMNEARINVGLGAAAVAYRSYRLALQYAGERLQGRTQRGQGEQVAIIEHPDVRRMLLSAKCYAEGALALVLYTAKLVDQTHVGNAEERREANAVLGLLTPIAKTWASEWGLAANDLAIQIHGGYGYTRDFDVEQLYRDNRLNPIHEGTTGIQALDFVGRKIIRDGGKGVALLGRRIQSTVNAAGKKADLGGMAEDLSSAWKTFVAVSERLIGDAGRTDVTHDATEMLAAAGHIVVAWQWLDQALLHTTNERIRRGCMAACSFFFEAELPRVHRSLAIVASRSGIAAKLPHDAF